MMQTLRAFLAKEFRQALRDPRMRMLLFVAPMIQLTIFGLAISTDIKNVDLWARIDTNDTVLRHIVERSVVNDWFIEVPVKTGDRPYAQLRSGRADAVLIPPPGGLTREMGRGDAQLQLLINATNVLEAQAVEQYIRAITMRVIEDDLHVKRPPFPIQFNTRVLYNPSLETSFFMVPGVMAMLLSITTIILTSMSITREKELGTFEMLVSAPVSASVVILGKTIPYFVLAMVQVPLILGVAVFGFGVPLRGSILEIFVASVAFAATTVAVGTAISTVANNQQQSTMAGFLFLFPAILLSGLMFPIENMPEIMKWASYIDPLMHYLALLRNIMLKGGDTSFVLTHSLYLVVMAIFAVIFAFRRFHTTLQ
ncbi:MAG: ABC transporter permease [Acidiferrobacterales bacterium]|jgi:ABC-2 type transport system permease protein|nr:ABC transporter permease [Acidiferrobacterales bacterium]